MEDWKLLNMGLELVSRFVLQKSLIYGQRINTDIVVVNNAAMEEKRQQIQLLQIKLQYIKNQENREFQAEQAQLNHQRQKELQEYIQSVNLEIQKSNIDRTYAVTLYVAY
ncbi:hypothetical protein [Planktothrix paucivesiculata]|uniref:Uncharacterized protein n=1 Tax=Planktothrix paucivesiculata PCC 9631 TaxID=671071 RepID=A0A7Z9BKK7_9CYAN|nr:hypothetical protein [Planktothrix paucivesiculata]VXD14654.1 hypothetical protein PL9631_110096 [Planktothrix paucivesiculata PCC 9631]